MQPSAYDETATDWAAGPDRVFDVLAGVLLQGGAWRGLQVLDVGTGTGTAAVRLAHAGARVVAVDFSSGMLAIARERSGCRAVVADVAALPLAARTVDAAVLGFVVNHLSDPAHGLREVARVVRAGGVLRASTWAHDDPRHVQSVVDRLLLEQGWSPPGWYTDFKKGTSRLTDTPETLAFAARSAGLQDIRVRSEDVPLPLSTEQLLAWRLGLPHTAPWLAGLQAAARQRLVGRALAGLSSRPDTSVRVLFLDATT